MLKFCQNIYNFTFFGCISQNHVVLCLRNNYKKDTKGVIIMLTVSVLLDSVEKVQKFVSLISKYDCDFDIESGHSCVDAKSIVGIFSLDIYSPLRLTINRCGENTEDILRDINEFMEY